MKKLWILVFGLGLAGQASAYDAVIKAVKGEVFVKAAGTDRFKPAKYGHKLMKDEQVRTGPGGAVQVAFRSGSTVLVKENSRFLLRIDKFGDFVSFSKGEFLIGLGKKLKPGRK